MTDEEAHSWDGWSVSFLGEESGERTYFWSLDLEVLEVLVEMRPPEDLEAWSLHYPLLEFAVDVVGCGGVSLLVDDEVRQRRFKTRREAARAGIKEAKKFLHAACRDLDNFTP